MRRLLLVTLLVGLVVPRTTRAPLSTDLPASAEHLRIAAGEPPVASRAGGLLRTRCGLQSRLVVTLRALSTPLVGRDLELEVSVADGLPDGVVHIWLRLPGGLDATAGTSWTEFMTRGQTVRHRVTVRVNSGAPLPVTAKAASLEPAHAGQFPGESHVTLYPLELAPGGVRVHWSATTLRALAEPEPAMVTLRGGDRAVVIRGDP